MVFPDSGMDVHTICTSTPLVSGHLYAGAVATIQSIVDVSLQDPFHGDYVSPLLHLSCFGRACMPASRSPCMSEALPTPTAVPNRTAGALQAAAQTAGGTPACCPAVQLSWAGMQALPDRQDYVCWSTGLMTRGE